MIKLAEKRMRVDYIQDYEPIDESGLDAIGNAIMSYYILICSTTGVVSTIPFYNDRDKRDLCVKQLDEICF